MPEETWGVPIAVDLFFAGVGGGSFILSAMASRRNGEGWETCSQGAALLAPLAIFAGLSMLILDLGYPSRFWMTLRTFNLHSPMSIGSWLLSLFVIVALLFALYWLPVQVRARIPWVSTLMIWKKVRWRDRLGMIGMVLAVGVCVYTGVLLSATVIPLWRSLSLAVLFLLSAITTGFAGGGTVMLCLSKKMNSDPVAGPLQFIRRSYRIVLPLYLLVALGFSLWPTLVPGPSPAFNTLTRGWSGLIWWLGVMGIGGLVPYFLVLKAKTIRMRQAWVLFSCLLIGGFLLRLVIILGGQGAL
jgi:formate-dependent nitrite reductase membrane component NrfD